MKFVYSLLLASIPESNDSWQWFHDNPMIIIPWNHMFFNCWWLVNPFRSRYPFRYPFGYFRIFCTYRKKSPPASFRHDPCPPHSADTWKQGYKLGFIVSYDITYIYIHLYKYDILVCSSLTLISFYIHLYIRQYPLNIFTHWFISSHQW